MAPGSRPAEREPGRKKVAVGRPAGNLRPRMRSVARVCLLCAWLCASGALLDVAQVAAWGRMFAGYARSESLAAAARETFDPGKPCAICRAVSKARAASNPAAPRVATADKLVLIFDAPATLVVRAASPDWPVPGDLSAATRPGDVPVPPPRAVAA